MNIFLPILFLSISIHPLNSSPLHDFRFLKRLRQNDTQTPQEYIQVSKPLPYDSLIPSCYLPVFSYSFGNTVNLPPATVNYSAPANCPWTHAALDLRFDSRGEQYDRIAAVWLDGVELIRTSTAEPTDDGIFWNVRKDVTRYSSLLSKENLTLSVMLENIINEELTGYYQVNLTFFYYDFNAFNPALALPLDNVEVEVLSSARKMKLLEEPLELSVGEEKESVDLYEKPADLIIPISAEAGDEGHWFRIQSGSDVGSVGIQVPPNTYRAVVEVYVSFHGNDEFWYSNPPDSYIEMNKLNTKRGHGSYREVLLTIDGNLVGSVVPFPVIFTGGINPLFWEPVVSIGAFDLPTYNFILTPFLGLLLDGKTHSFGLGVAESIPFWLLDANLHLWLDNEALEVQAGVDYKAPTFSTDREFEFEGLDGEFEIETKRKSEVIGWVNSTAGNLTYSFIKELEFENEVKYKNNGTRKTIEQKVKEKDEVKVLSSSGILISQGTMEREYPLKITSETVAGNVVGTYLTTTKLENSIEEKKSVGRSKNSLKNKQECSGWMFVQDHNVVSGEANTRQNYSFKADSECYSRNVAAYNGKILNDSSSVLCASSL